MPVQIQEVRSDVKSLNEARRSLASLLRQAKKLEAAINDGNFGIITASVGVRAPQFGTTADPDLLTLATNLATVKGDLTVEGVVKAGSGANQITTAAGLLDGSKLDANINVANPPAWGTGTPKTGRFTTVQSTVSTGTAPFIVASTTEVANLNAALLKGVSWSNPPPIGDSAANTGRFSQVTVTATGTAPFVISSQIEVANLNAALLKGKNWAAPDPLGITTPNSVKCTTFEATGSMKFGSFTSDVGAIIAGYISIQDAAGNTRKLLVAS